MRFPRITIAAALVVAAMAVPAAAPPLDARPAGVIGMGHEGYEITGVHDARLGADGVPVITIHRGERLTLPERLAMGPHHRSRKARAAHRPRATAR